MPSVDSFEKPSETGAPPPPARGTTGITQQEAPIKNPMNKPGAQNDDPLPAGWIEKVSSSHNKIYFYNTATGESVWVKPTE
jgi:hypothetical protein